MWYEIYVFGYKDSEAYAYAYDYNYAGWTRVMRTNSLEVANNCKINLLNEYNEEDVDCNW